MPRIDDVRICNLWYENLVGADEEGKDHDVSSHGFVLAWKADIGFGELTVGQASDGQLEIDSEKMDKEFVEAVFKKLIDKAKIV